MTSWIKAYKEQFIGSLEGESPENINFRPHGGKPVHTSGCGVCAGKISG